MVKPLLQNSCRFQLYFLQRYQSHPIGGSTVKLEILVCLNEVIVTANLDGAVAETGDCHSDTTATRVDGDGWSCDGDQLPRGDLEVNVHDRVRWLLEYISERSINIIILMAWSFRFSLGTSEFV